MRFESRTWFLLSLLLFAAAIYFWKRGNDYQSRKNKSLPPVRQQVTGTAPTASTGPGPAQFKLLTRLNPKQAAATAARVQAVNTPGNPTSPSPTSTPATVDPRFPHRLSNSSKSIGQLTRVETAILMRNALIDTAEKSTALPIPESMRAEGDPGSYIVQARGPIQGRFREQLRNAGASTVSYIPNNAYLVQVTAAGAQQLAALPETQAVLPYEPYFKLDTKLLGLALDQKPLGSDQWLRITTFPGAVDEATRALTALGGEIISQERSPFGPQLLVKPALESLPAVAKLAAVQTIELYYPRELLNDLARVETGVSPSGSSATNYLNLTGSNVLVNINDSGVDSTHPDLQGRVIANTPAALQDAFTHGTHVAGTIAGNGSKSSSVTAVPPGSGTKPNFRGMAPGAHLLSLPFQSFPEVGRPLQDSYLQETAARTNALFSQRKAGPMISNNSWGYVGANGSDSSSARYDAAVRDALPETDGSQPMIYVFAAGNSGEGADAGNLGDANSIPSPGNAKNVITVGAAEQFRSLTNSVFGTNDDGSISTNAPFFGLTDSSDEVASFSSRGNVGIGTEGDFGRFKPDLVAPGTFMISTRAHNWKLEDEVDTNSPQYGILKDLNAPLAPFYRYESGTSQATPVVSGILALMQEFFEQTLPTSLRRTNSPALMKALLINGARSLGPLYNLEVQNAINFQGWGLVNLTNSLPAVMLSQPEARWPIRLIDQNPTNALATGQSRSWNVALTTNAQDAPVRVTLVWTDPPGNPTAAIKLVNDLDLVVSNTVSGEIYYGNDIRTDSDFSHASFPDDPAVLDVVNNVENVFISDPASSNLVVTVSAKRVNVNATPGYNQVTGKTDDVVQDFALVISCGDTTITTPFVVTPIVPPPDAVVKAIPMTNGIPLLNQRAGANSPLPNLKNGITNQWNFFVFTNTFVTNDISTLTNGTNVAFITFLPPNVALPRNSSADLDLYVSKDPSLVDLNPAAVDGAWKSLTRSGTESIIFTNAQIGDVFYIGVKSEDQQSGEYGLIGLSTDQPFDENHEGSRILHGLPVPQVIPDGTPHLPGHTTIFAIGISPVTIKKAIVTDVLTHQDVGDLSIILTHEQNSVVLHNHTLNNGFFDVTNAVFIYDDQSFGVAAGQGTRHSDGPGSLTSFIGSQGTGVWMFNVVDNAPGNTGRVQNVTIELQPFINGSLNEAGAAGISGNVLPNDMACYFVDVPPEGTNLVVDVSQVSGPLVLYLGHGSVPSTNTFDKTALINPPGGTVTLGANDQPIPLQAGRTFVCLYNPSITTTVAFHLTALVQVGVGLDYKRTLVGTNLLGIPDDGLTTSTVNVPVDKQVADVKVAVRIDHPRSSDLVLHLISPQGTRILLAENRGGNTSQGYGAGYGTNISYTIFTEDTNLLPTLAPIKFALPPWTNLTTSTNPPVFSNSFENADPGVYITNQTFSPWTVTQGQAAVRGPGNPFGVSANTGTNFVELDTTNTPASIVATFGTVPGKEYLLTFFYQRNRAVEAGTPHGLQVYYGPQADLRPAVKFIDVPSFSWESTNIVFTATTESTELEFGALTAVGPFLDSVTVSDVVNGTNVFVLPEESLGALQGQRALGDWTLEVWDNRQGPAGSGKGTLISWQLQLEYGSPPGLANVATNGVTASGIVSGSQTNFFYADICESAKVAFASLSGPFNRMNLLVSRSGFPTGVADRDDFFSIPNDLPVDETLETGLATFALTSDPHQPAPLLPGGRLFFAVHNLNPDETNAFDFRVVVSPDTCVRQRPIIRLFNDVPYTNVVAPSRSLIDYYVFNVTPTAVRAEFEVRPRNGDVGMVLSYGQPLPDLTKFDYQSDRPGITNELIVVTNTSSPVSLAAGDWFVGVYNNETNAVVYDVRASEVLDTNLNVIVLTNSIPVDFTLQQDAKLTNFFLFTVLDPVPGVKFELYNLNGNADLFIGYNIVPSPTTYFLSNSASPTTPITIEINTNASLPEVTGNWMLEVVNRAATNLTFSLRASLLQPTNNVPSTTNRVFDPDITVSTTNICFSWAATVGLQYELQGIKGVTDTNWTTLFGPETATNALMSFCLHLPTPYSFFRVVELGSGSTPPPEKIINPSLTVNSNSICLSWPSTVGSIYQVQGRTSLVTGVWTDLAAPITATSTNSIYCVSLPSPFQFFQVIENPGGGTNQPPPGGTAILNPSLTVTSNSICLAWPSTIGSIYQVQGRTSLVSGVWTDLGAPITATSTNSTYCVSLPSPFQFFQVVENPGGGTNPPPTTGGTIINPALTVTSNSICLAWPSTIGATYQVQGRVSLTTGAWTNLTALITATNTTTTYCVSLPSPFQFFQVIENPGGGTNPPPTTGGTIINPALTVTSNSICLAWPSTIGATYQVQGRVSLTTGTWTNLTALITATNTTSTYCVSLPSPFQFFQVIENPGGGTTPPPNTGGTIINPALTVTSNSICLAWPSTIGATYQVQGRVSLTTGTWTNLTALITATNTTSTYCVSLPSPFQFFQVIENPGGGTTPPPNTAGGVLEAALAFNTNGLCLTWASQAGVQYDVQARLNITDAGWTNVAGPITATGPATTQCLPRTTPFHFFQIRSRSSSGSSSGSSTNGAALHTPAILADGRLQLVWDTTPGLVYEVQVATNLLPVVKWSTLTNFTASGASATVTDTNKVNTGVMRFYRIVNP